MIHLVVPMISATVCETTFHLTVVNVIQEDSMGLTAKVNHMTVYMYFKITVVEVKLRNGTTFL